VLQEESGWKLVHADVLRPPSFALLLSVSVGTGTQLMLMALQQEAQSAPPGGGASAQGRLLRLLRARLWEGEGRGGVGRDTTAPCARADHRPPPKSPKSP
jgi:hypothetical protein